MHMNLHMFIHTYTYLFVCICIDLQIYIYLESLLEIFSRCWIAGGGWGNPNPRASAHLFEEEFNAEKVAVVRGADERRLAKDVALLEIGALLNEQAGHGEVTAAHGKHKRRVPAMVRLIQRRALQTRYETRNRYDIAMQ